MPQPDPLAVPDLPNADGAHAPTAWQARREWRMALELANSARPHPRPPEVAAGRRPPRDRAPRLPRRARVDRLPPRAPAPPRLPGPRLAPGPQPRREPRARRAARGPPPRDPRPLRTPGQPRRLERRRDLRPRDGPGPARLHPHGHHARQPVPGAPGIHARLDDVPVHEPPPPRADVHRRGPRAARRPAAGAHDVRLLAARRHRRVGVLPERARAPHRERRGHRHPPRLRPRARDAAGHRRPPRPARGSVAAVRRARAGCGPCRGPHPRPRHPRPRHPTQDASRPTTTTGPSTAGARAAGRADRRGRCPVGLTARRDLPHGRDARDPHARRVAAAPHLPEGREAQLPDAPHRRPARRPRRAAVEPAPADPEVHAPAGAPLGRGRGVRRRLPRAALRAAGPGGERELGILVSRLHSHQLDFSRPPWELHVIEGLDARRFAVYVKIHHSLVDGYTGQRILQRGLSTDPDDREHPFFFSTRKPPGRPGPARGRPGG